MARTRLIPLALVLAAAAPAKAGEVPCWFDAGVVVAPAEVAGIAGDWILDTGTARTALHNTRAEAEGIAETELVGDVRLAGLVLRARPLVVADLDVRAWNLPTPAAGVIGTDILKDYVVDISFRPCRVRLSRPGEAPPFRADRALPLAWDAGLPLAEAEAGDGERRLKGPFVVATGLNVPARLADDVAAVPGSPKPDELYPDGVWLARLDSLTFAGRTHEGPGAGLMKPQGQAAGIIGGAVLSRFRLRFDFPGGRLLVAERP